MFEIREVLRLWAAGLWKKRIAAQVGLNVKTVRRYLMAALAAGVIREEADRLDEDRFAALVVAIQPVRGRDRGEGWATCAAEREFIARHLAGGVRLSKIGKLLRRRGVDVRYPTLRRFSIMELGFGSFATTIPVADCDPGQEVQVDVGWMTYLEPDERGKRSRFRALIFTAVRSRHRFVWPITAETTAAMIEGCEAAWEFFGGIFRVLIPDNTKAIVQKADPLEPRTGALRQAIAAGNLAPGQELPSARQLAGDLSIHWNTVARAYRTLADEGLLVVVQGRRAHVRPPSERPRVDARQAREEIRDQLREVLTRARLAGPPSRDFLKLINEEIRRWGGVPA